MADVLFPARGIVRVKLMGHSGEPIGDVLLLRPWLLYKSYDSPIGTSLPLQNKKKCKRPVQRKGKKPTYQELLRHYTQFGKSRRNPMPFDKWAEYARKAAENLWMLDVQSFSPEELQLLKKRYDRGVEPEEAVRNMNRDYNNPVRRGRGW